MKKKYYQLFFLASAALLLPFCGTAQVSSIPVGSATRNMIVYAPSALPQNRPLIISMHGANQDAGYQKGQAKWEAISVTVSANAGIHNVRLEATGSNGLPNIDYVDAGGGMAADCGAATARMGSNATTAHLPEEVNAQANKNIVVMPNPAKNRINVTLASYWKQGDNISIFNAAGKKILSRYLHTNVEEFNIASLPAGIYIIQVSNKESQKSMRQFIKTKN